MIICFSGTGNSRRVARELKKSLGDDILEINAELLRTLDTKPQLKNAGQRIVWVFPVYAWGLPEVVERVMKTVVIPSSADIDHWMVCTCGDDIGHTQQLWREVCRGRGWRPMSAFSVAMPNRYVFLPGFKFDDPSVAESKLDAMPGRVARIAQAILAERRSADVVVEGAMPGLKSDVLRPLFNKFLVSPKGFKVDPKRCTACGTCVKVCPLDNVELCDSKPQWGSNCTFCTACFFFCPQKAIAWKLF